MSENDVEYDLGDDFDALNQVHDSGSHDRPPSSQPSFPEATIQEHIAEANTEPEALSMNVELGTAKSLLDLKVADTKVTELSDESNNNEEEVVKEDIKETDKVAGPPPEKKVIDTLQIDQKEPSDESNNNEEVNQEDTKETDKFAGPPPEIDTLQDDQKEPSDESNSNEEVNQEDTKETDNDAGPPPASKLVDNLSVYHKDFSHESNSNEELVQEDTNTDKWNDLLTLRSFEIEKIEREHLANEAIRTEIPLKWGKAVKSKKKKDEDDDRGWVYRKMDEYVDINSDCAPFDEIVDTFSSKISRINLSKFPRSLHDDSRMPFSLIMTGPKSQFLKQFRKLFFKKDKNEFSDFVEYDFLNEKLVVPTTIKFEGKNTNDYRIQLEFDSKSRMHQMVEKALNAQGIIDSEHEYIEDVSLLIGGTDNQSVHGDIPRTYCYWKDDSEKVRQVHEVNREKYNDAVSDKHGMSSIIIDLSSDQSGFFFAIPKQTIWNETKLTCMTPFSNNKLRFVGEEKGPDDTDLVIIKIYTGCQFSADFMHAGANNVQKLPDSERVAYREWLSTVSKKIYNQNVPLTNIFNALNNEKEIDVSKTTRFFCKTFPKKIVVMKMKENVYFPECNIGEFDLFVREIKEKIEMKNKKPKAKDLTPITSPPSERILRSKPTAATPDLPKPETPTNSRTLRGNKTKAAPPPALTTKNPTETTTKKKRSLKAGGTILPRSRVSFNPHKRARIHQFDPQQKEIKPKSLLKRESTKKKSLKK
jgi:hypothetical protein